MRGTKFFFIAAVIVLLALAVNGLYVVLKFGSSISNSEIDNDSHDPDVLLGKPKEAETIGKQVGQHEGGIAGDTPINVMVLGLDGDKTRCDVVMLFNFDPGSHELNILSIARDTRIFTGSSYRKINSFYSKGGEERVAREISRITGIPVHYYITADFKGFRKIIDTLGGVEFYVPFRMKYRDPTQDLYINLQKGQQLLDGKKAEQLVRYRKGNYKGQGYIEGDIGRIRMQQDFIKALIDQKFNVWNVSKADDIFAILQDYVKTNITISDIVRYAGDAAKIRSDNIRTFVLPGESYRINDVWWYVYDRKKTAAIIEGDFMQPDSAKSTDNSTAN